MELSNYITVQETMQLLKLSRPGVYRILKNEKWNTIKVGNTRLFLRADVEKTPPREVRKPHYYKGNRS